MSGIEPVGSWYHLQVRKPHCFAAVLCVFLVVACGSPEPEIESLPLHDFRVPSRSLVAHALGGIEGQKYSNSLEALEGTLARGGRFLEADLSFTADHDLVCFHTKHEKHLGVETPITEMTTTAFLGRTYRGKYTLIDIETLMRHLVDHPETYLITDCKHDFNQCLEAVLSAAESMDPTLVGRIIPQFYAPDQWRDVALMEAEHGAFATVIFTLYRTKIDDDTVVELAESVRIPVITMSQERFNPDLVARLSKIGVDSLVHTVNNPKHMINFVDQGVRGLYTDNFVQWEEVTTAAESVRAPPTARPQCAAANPPRG